MSLVHKPEMTESNLAAQGEGLRGRGRDRRLTNVVIKSEMGGTLPLEMLKTKIDPAMYMKKKASSDTMSIGGQAFYTKMQQFLDSRQQSAGLLAENADISR